MDLHQNIRNSTHCVSAIIRIIRYCGKAKIKTTIMYFLRNKLKWYHQCQPRLPSLMLLCHKRTAAHNNKPASAPVKLAYVAYETDAVVTSSVPPVVIMHGLYASARNMKSIARSIHLQSKPQRNVYILDARNHGQSPHTDTHTYDDLTNDIAKFFADHMIKRAILMGHSMGGRTMMCVALKHVRLSPETFKYMATYKHIEFNFSAGNS